ncbi:hypothetical protein [Magnetospirillum sp. 15-1]|uniref:hypothetical protein n=1 Tax=Magnetospirillum sp. 15-1 TaxID=1979370 RepID=UPI000BBBA866|nr:hypothetical protein [Magnetospirillum sp. 15-1]
MSADIQRLRQLRERAQSARCDDHTTMTDAEVDELIALERLHAAEQAGIRVTLRQEAEQRKTEAERQERRNATALPYRQPSSRPGRGLDLITRGLDNA